MSDTDITRGYDKYNPEVDCLKKDIKKLKSENEVLNSKLIDLLFEANYNKQTELIEFIRNL